MNKQDFDDKYRGTFANVQDESLLQLACVRHEFLKEWHGKSAMSLHGEEYTRYVQQRAAIDKVLGEFLLDGEAKDLGRLYHRLKENMSEEDITRTAARCVARPEILKRVAAVLAPKGRDL